MEINVNKTEQHTVELTAEEVERACVNFLLLTQPAYKDKVFKIESIDVNSRHDVLNSATIRITKLVNQS
jgi:hypothetical protein